MHTFLHTESSLGRGGQEIRTLAETRWLIDHGWNALIACQPHNLPLRQAQAPSAPWGSIRAGDGADGGAPLVGLVANVRGSKGHNVFLDAARAVLAVTPDTRFLIVGDGVGFDEVKARVQQRGLESRVHLTGFRRDVPEVMAALDVLVLPSTRSEATSQVIPQALAVRTPVVATAVGGIPEIVKDGVTGRLVPPGEPDALARPILGMTSD